MNEWNAFSFNVGPVSFKMPANFIEYFIAQQEIFHCSMVNISFTMAVIWLIISLLIGGYFIEYFILHGSYFIEYFILHGAYFIAHW